VDENRWTSTPSENARLIRETVATNLRRERRRAGMSQDALAKASGVGRDTITRLEAAQREPRLLTLLPLTFALGIQLQTLLFGLPGPGA
jgi:transcriptional regulator with XRE-family HTH domain